MNSMMGKERMTKDDKKGAPAKRSWLVTGCAGFIGSHIVERLLSDGHVVRGIDDLSTGSMENIEDALRNAGEDAAGRFTFIEGDILDKARLEEAMKGAYVVLHQAALGSVPRSIEEPLETTRANVDGFVAVVKAAVDGGVRRVVYASSSSVYGDHPDLPKVEDVTGAPLSPYAASKLADEVFAEALTRSYGVELVGLRYFNVFGQRQSPEGPYAAVIPRWIDTLLEGGRPIINGDPEISRDFTYIDNAVEANILAAETQKGVNTSYNIAAGERTTLAELLDGILDAMMETGALKERPEPVMGPPRPGDVKHSLADISKARAGLGYEPRVGLEEGLRRTVRWSASRRAAG